MNKTKRGIITGIIAVSVIVIGVWILSLKPTTDASSNNEVMLMHIHPSLYLNFNGKPYMVPQNVGIDPELWKNHSLDQYGMMGMAPVHTHTADGTLHVESKIIRNYTLGEFFDIWGLDLKGDTITATSYNEPISDWKNHVLKDNESIIMNITSGQ
jgi:hypothetical protein